LGYERTTLNSDPGVNRLIVHAADIKITEESGMGRIAWHWRREFERRGYEVAHIGPDEVGSLRHPGLFPFAAYRHYRRLRRQPALLLLHEAASGAFMRERCPTVVFSHGIERRAWRLALEGKGGARVRWRTRVAFPIWRLRQCDRGLRRAAKVLVSNREDADFARRHYRRDAEDIFVFRNGVYPSRLHEENGPADDHVVLFVGSWLERKGVETLVQAAGILDERRMGLKWLIAGTGLSRDDVLARWPAPLRAGVEVVPHFARETEERLLGQASLFVLPSFFEGQPLALLQAMECGRCCITSDCCGQRDLIQHRDNGLLHQPGDAQKLAALIAECVADGEMRTRLGRNAKRSVEGRRWEAVSAEVADVVT
jgi:glycosyltransferase involved in cell wall biosynthesis